MPSCPALATPAAVPLKSIVISDDEFAGRRAAHVVAGLPAEGGGVRRLEPTPWSFESLTPVASRCRAIPLPAQSAWA